MKSIFLYCRRHKLSEALLANLKARCPEAGTLECYRCECAGFRLTSKGFM